MVLKEKKETVEDEVTVQDRLNELGVKKDELYQEETGLATKDEGADNLRKPRVLAINDGSKKGKLMIAELKERGVDVVSEVRVDFKDVVKSVKNTVKSESQKNNEYDVVYLPVTNTDFNKNVQAFDEIRRDLGVPVNLYFADRDDVDIANKAHVRKIE